MVLLYAALLPSLFLMYRIYQADRVEREPVKLIIKVIFFGVLSTIPASVLEMLGILVLDKFIGNSASILYLVLEFFIVVAFAEEGCKMLALRIGIWKNPEFNYLFDGVVYGAASALGFAAFENVLYVIEGGMPTAIVRAVTAVPLHCICGIFMGHYYGLAKNADRRGNAEARKAFKRLGFFIPAFIHGLYDFLASVESDLALFLFLAVVIVVDIIAIRHFKRYAMEDIGI